MSVLKKRRKTKRKSKAIKNKAIRNQFDKHHIFYIRRKWRRGILNQLRQHPYCVVLIPRDTLHLYIHSNLAAVPVARGCIVKEVLFHLKVLNEYGAIGLDDPIEKRLLVLTALFDCADQATADALKEQLRLVHEFKKAPK